MLSKVVRIGILAMLVVVLGLAGVGAKAAQMESVNRALPVEGCDIFPFFLISDTSWTCGEIYGVPWNGSFDPNTWPVDFSFMSFETQANTFGELQAEYENRLGYPVVLLRKSFLVDISAANFVGAGVNLSAVAGPVVPIFLYSLPDPSDPLPFVANVAVFKAPGKGQENFRLTLFGYVNDDNKSCVLWSLDGSRNLNVTEKCGGEAELVCTVKLVGKALEYDCEGGYDWLGEQIIHDPDWLAWADKFASKNGKK